MSETTSPVPNETVPVRLIGGPDDWHGQDLTIHTAAELAGPREALGTYLISNHVPAGHPDPGARAVFEPDSEPAPATTWFFRGWFPYGPHDLENRTADQIVPVDVESDEEGLPTGWVTDEGERHRVDRILAHWQANLEDDLGFGVWHVRSGGADYELRAHPGHWEAGRLPEVEVQEHDDTLI
ncbi:hypothetical protein [Nocardiopsis alba]|uniref:hypothetical protein n=1 Tax=Nocardiopsis alba TaxID=53437 RepID=UPI0033AD09E9